MKARHWCCPKCGWTYESPIPVIAVKCPKHKGAGVMMKAAELAVGPFSPQGQTETMAP